MSMSESERKQMAYDRAKEIVKFKRIDMMEDMLVEQQHSEIISSQLAEIEKEISLLRALVEKNTSAKPTFDFDEFQGENKKLLEKFNEIYTMLDSKMDASEVKKIFNDIIRIDSKVEAIKDNCINKTDFDSLLEESEWLKERLESGNEKQLEKRFDWVRNKFTAISNSCEKNDSNLNSFLQK